MNQTPRLPSLLALAVVTAVALAEQVIITRLLSAVLAYHMSFLAISIAMLGTGAAAMFVFLRPAWFSGEPERVLSRWSLVLAVTLVVVPFGMAQLDFSGGAALSADFAVNLAVACLLSAGPPFASGVVVALAIDRYRSAIGTVYAFDLVGAGVGALIVVPALSVGPAPHLLLALGVIAALAATLFGWSHRWERQNGFLLAFAATAMTLLSSVSSLLYLEPRYELPPGTLKVAEHWTPLARCFGFELPHPGSPALLFYDRVYAPVIVVKDGELPDWQALRTGPASIGFAMAGPGHALIIGGGGGRDIYNALSSGQSPVDVIELIDGNRRVVDEDLGYLSGSPYSRPGVRTVIGDGRSTLASRADLYDQVHIGFTDTLTANAAQGFALTENNLYTVEAFQEYFDHLKPTGILNVSRLLKLVGDEALRATVLTLKALEQRGVADPFRHVVVVLGTDILGPPTGTILARLTPFNDEEIAKIEKLAGERANGLLMAPGRPGRFSWKQLAESRDIDGFCAAHRLDVCAPTDDRPFFFNMARLTSLGRMYADGYTYAASPMTMLLVTLLVLSLLCLVAFALPLLLGRGRMKAGSMGSLVYFAAIGVGFLLFEIAQIQRLVLFLGFPTYALSIVLFALLISSGVGSYVSSRFEEQRPALIRVLITAVVLIAVGAVGLPFFLERGLSLAFPLRAVIAVLLVAPFGLVLGMAMPMGLTRLGAVAPDLLPYAWGVNGITSVLASVLGVFIATEVGFTATQLAASACYAVALSDAIFGRWGSPA